MEHIYPAVFHSNNDGSYTIIFPDLHGCISEGKSLGNALRMAQAALSQWIEYLTDKKQEISQASDIVNISVSDREFVNFIRADVRDVMMDYFELFRKVNTYFKNIGRDDCDDCDDECKRDWIVHTLHVFFLCNTFINLLNRRIVQVDEEMLLVSAILHDIAKPEGKKHNKQEYLIKAFKEAGIKLPSEHELKVYKIIKAHKGNFSPEVDCTFESAVLRICDKLDKYRKGKKSASKDCSKTMELIKDYLINKSHYSKWKELERVYLVMSGFISYLISE